MLKIVLLDTNKLPQRWTESLQYEISLLGEYKSYFYTDLTNLLDNAADADIILTNKALINREHLKHLTKLKYIIVVATGYDCVDISECKRLNIPVSNVPSYSTFTVAQHTIALLLELTNNVAFVSNFTKQKSEYSVKHPWCIELSNLILGVIGFGAIAQQVIKIASAMGMRLLVHTRTNYHTDLGVEFVSKDELFERSDVISLHCPCTDETINLINAETISLMKPNSYIINTARGALINEKDLFTALKNKQIMAAALDVLDPEPPEKDNPLFTLNNCIITPHIAYLSEQSLDRWLTIITDEIKSYLSGKLINLLR